MCDPRGRRSSEDENGDFIFESVFDKDENFFAYILMYILVELIIDNSSTLLSFSLMN